MDIEMESDSEEGEEVFVDSTRPKPGPRKSIIKAKAKRKNSDDDDTILSRKEYQYMGAVISCITRKSITGSESHYNTNENIIVVNSAPRRTICLRIQKIMALQPENWLDKQIAPFQETSCLKEILELYTKRRSEVEKPNFPKQLYIEHLSWLTYLSGRQGNNYDGVSEENSLDWLEKFCTKYFTVIAKLKYSPVDISTIKYAAMKVTHDLLQLSVKSLNSRNALQKLRDLVCEVQYDKSCIMRDFKDMTPQHINLEVGDQEEPLSRRLYMALQPPYFKDGIMHAPQFTKNTESNLLKQYGLPFFKTHKQKWTTNDLTQLKSCVTKLLTTKHLEKIQDRYESLLNDCIRQYKNDKTKEEIDGQGSSKSRNVPLRREVNKNRKSELFLNPKYGNIFPLLTKVGKTENDTQSDIEIRYQVTPEYLQNWRVSEEAKLKKMTFEQLVFSSEETKIEWAFVADEMVSIMKKMRTPEDCELVWKHELHPTIKQKRWTMEETKRLGEIYKRFENNDWVAVANQLNAPNSEGNKPGRTPYQCFFRVRNKIAPPKKTEWNDTLDKELVSKVKEYSGNFRVVAASISDQTATKRQCIDRFKKTANPILRRGPFTRVEDCLLMLTIEKLKPFLALEGGFGCLFAYLPWRNETTWRDRTSNLFCDWTVPWTLKEDKKLLKLAVTMNRNWQRISEKFDSFKNRKGCLTRFKILETRLKDKRFNNSLEQYHEAYSMTRYNVFQCNHLTEVLKILLRVERQRNKNPLPRELQRFPGLLQDEQPSEVRLQHMLLTFDKRILGETIESLTRYLKSRNNYWEKWKIEHGEKKLTFDRRTFHPDNAQSVASALHIRGILLKDKSDIPNLTEFENDIYKFYARFSRTKAIKDTVVRPYIPSAERLADLQKIRRLVATSLENDEMVSNKWTSTSKIPKTKSKSTSATREKPVQKGKRGRKPLVRNATTTKVRNALNKGEGKSKHDVGKICDGRITKNKTRSKGNYSLRGRKKGTRANSKSISVPLRNNEPKEEKNRTFTLRRSSRHIVKPLYFFEDEDSEEEVETMELVIHSK